MKKHNSLILCIMDGWGIAPASAGNAITQSKTPNYNYLLEHFPNSELEASGLSVGLPADQDGSSETGHLNIGAGRIVYQDLARINMSIADGSFFKNPALLSAINHVQKNTSDLHLVGLVGASGVHAYNDHLFALMLMAKHHSLKNVYIHMITDGRDSPPKNAIEQLAEIERQIERIGVGKIVSISGRYYAMDRDMRLERTQLAFDAFQRGDSPHFKTTREAIEHSYASGATDEFIMPATIGTDYSSTRISEKDALILYNFRIDRPRQITKMIIDHHIADLHLVTMTEYHKHFEVPVAFASNVLEATLAESFFKNNLRQLHTAESEKERFVTYYYNGEREEPFQGEDRLIVASPKVATYDLRPEMSTPELITTFYDRWSHEDYAFGVINIACPDMVGHTGNIPACIKAIEATDSALKRLMDLSDLTGSYLLVTADHGNAEEMLNLTTGEIDTEHSTNPVPFIAYHPKFSSNYSLHSGVLADVAPTVLSILELPQPALMSGTNLLHHQA